MENRERVINAAREGAEMAGSYGLAAIIADARDKVKYANKIKLAKGSPPIMGAGLIGLAYDAVSSGDFTEKAFNTQDPSLGQYAAGAVYNMADGLLLGQISDKEAKTKHMYDFYTKKYKDFKKWMD